MKNNNKCLISTILDHKTENQKQNNPQGAAATGPDHQGSTPLAHDCMKCIHRRFSEYSRCTAEAR